MNIDQAIEMLNPDNWEPCEDQEDFGAALEMAVAALKRQRWIPCSERLPPDGVCVLIWDAIEGDVFTGAVSNGTFCVDGFEDEQFVWKITHWLPLPEPPEEGGDENAAD